jgi:hypothetical protein
MIAKCERRKIASSATLIGRLLRETGKLAPIANNLAAIRAAPEAAGVIFLDNDESHGVKLKSKPKTEEPAT